MEKYGNVDELAKEYNRRLYYKHREHRQILLDKNYAFIAEYENDTVAIINKLHEYAVPGIAGYTQSIDRWLDETTHKIDDEIKVNALRQLFSQSRVALIYGAAGTGKSTIIDHIAQYFNEKSKLFLAHTNPAIDNLKRKVTSQNVDFRTISSQIRREPSEQNYDLLVIDECSTVSNSDLIKIIEHSSFKLIVLVGDMYQIESIQFGNWFSIISSFIPNTSVFELTKPYRTKNQALLDFWDKVRSIEDDIAEVMARNNYSTVLDTSISSKLKRLMKLSCALTMMACTELITLTVFCKVVIRTLPLLGKHLLIKLGILSFFMKLRGFVQLFIII